MTQWIKVFATKLSLQDPPGRRREPAPSNSLLTFSSKSRLMRTPYKQIQNNTENVF